MKRAIFTMLLMAAVAVTANAVPAKRISKTVIIDGKEVVLTFKGDESCHYWEAADGSKFMQKDDDVFERLSETTVQTMMNSPRKTVRPKYQGMTPTQVRAKRKAQGTGQKNGLVILVNFKDKSFTSTSNPKATYENVVNGVNYKGSKNYGSVRDYFKAQSYGQLDFNFDIAGPVTLSQNMAYYGANDSSGNDIRPGTMIWEACKAVDNEVDFSKYDNDGDGEVDQVFVVYAGYGESQSSSTNTIWPHAWYLSAAAYSETGIGSQYFDGVKVDSYACSSELAGRAGKTMDGIGTICHEFSHCLGLPDFYCTDGSHSMLTMGEWSIMDYGCYNGNENGYTPASYTAYERWYSGWIEPTVLSKPQYVKDMGNIDTDGECYVVYNDAHKDEFYIMQNVRKTGWNAYAPANGMLVLHVDYDANAWYNNTPNNKSSHLRMTPICADNNRSTTSLAGDTYPGSSKNTSLTDTSAPTASLFHENVNGRRFMGKPITEITEANGLISFTFMGGPSIEAPTNLHAKCTNGIISARWTAPKEDAVAYNLKYGVHNALAEEMAPIVDEDFAQLTGTSDATTDISAKLDAYLNLKGCTGNKLYKGKSGMKMGSSSDNGYLQTPLLEEKSGSIKVVIGATVYSSDASKLTLLVYNANGAEISRYPIALGQETECTVEVPESYSLRLAATKRIYLNKFSVESMASQKYAQETLISGIKENKISFTPAMTADEYWLAVQTVAGDGKTSEWTEYAIIEPKILLGDVNNDDVIDINDIVRLVSYVLDSSVELNKNAADVNGDGAIDVNDVVELVTLTLEQTTVD